MLKLNNLNNTLYKPLFKHTTFLTPKGVEGIRKSSTKNIDTHIFFLCTSFKTQLQEIAKLFNIKSFPKQLFNDFHAKKNEIITYYLDNTKLIFIGYGVENECNPDILYEIALSMGKKISNEDTEGNKNIMIHLLKNNNDLYIHHLVSGIILGNYKFDLLKSKDSKVEKSKKTIYFYHPKKSVFKSIQNYITLSQIHNEVRNYMNLPSNLLRIVDYIKYMKLFLPKNVSLKIINKKMLQKLGMNLILAVNQGANQDCALVVLEYKGTKGTKDSNNKPICFIGKGVMFDSGGYSIKTRSMEGMKFDMTASAIMYGLIKSHSLLKSSGHYIALLPLVENMVSENAIRPSDVIISHSGKSVEIMNTDAEGRLIIADCMSYCKKYNPKLIVDMGTLSGETAHIFGNKSSVIMGNNFKINRELMAIGKKYHENIWELPMWDIYLDELKSEIADLRNVSKSGKSSAITVGSFLSQFVPKNKDGKEVDWVHLDIAGTENAEGSPYYNDGAKIEILKTLYFYTK